jgi:hypothetical protein
MHTHVKETQKTKKNKKKQKKTKNGRKREAFQLPAYIYGAYTSNIQNKHANACYS